SHKSAEQKLDRRNELKARGTLLMALPDKHQLKFNFHKDAKTLMEAIEKRFGGNTETKKVQKTLLKQQFENFTGSNSENLDQIHNRLQKLVSQLKIHGVSLFQKDVNLNQSTSPQLDNEDLKQIDVDGLKEMDLKWQMAMLTMRARRFLQKTGRNLGDNKVTSMGFDMSKRRTALVENSTSNALVSQCDCIGSYDWSYQAEEEPTNFPLMAITSSNSSSDNEVPSCSKAYSKAYAQLHSQYEKLTDDFQKSQFDVLSYQAEENTKLLNVEVQARDTALVTLRQKLNQAEQERDDLKLKLDKFQTSSKNLNELLASQINDKHGLGYFSSESDSKTLSPSSPSDRLQPSGGYHDVPPPVTGTFMPPKPNLVFHIASIAVETDHSAFSPVEAPILDASLKPTSLKSDSSSKRKNRKTCFVWRSVDHLIKDCDFHAKKEAQLKPRNYVHGGNNKKNASFTHKHPPKHMVPTAVLTQSKPISITAVRPVCAVVPKIMMTRLRHAHSIDTKSKSPIRRHITRSPSPKTSNSPPRVTAAQAPVVSVAKGKKGKWVWRPKCPILDHDFKTISASIILKWFDYNDALGRSKSHMTGSMPYLSDFEELNGGYVAFGGNPKGGKISSKGKIKTCKLDFKVVYFVKELKFNLFSVSQICEKKNRVLFTDTECLVLTPDFKLPDESQNRVLVTKPHNKTPYELLHGRTLSIGFMRPFGCLVTILNTLDPLGKFEGKVDEGFLVGYSVNSKAFRVFNSRTRIVQETLHVNFLENKPNIAGSGPTWLFDIDSLTRTMNYQPVTAGNQSNPSACFQDEFDAEKAGEEVTQQYMLFLVWSSGSSNPQNKDKDAAFDEKEHDAKKPESAVNVSPSSSAQSGKQDDKTKKTAKGKSPVESFIGNRDLSAEFEDHSDNSSNDVNTAGSIVPTFGQNSSNSTNPFSAVGPSNTTASPTHGKSLFKDASQLPDNPDMLEMEDITYFDHENAGAEADFNILETSITVSLIPTTRTHKDHPVSQIIGDLSSTTQTTIITRVIKDQGGLPQIFNDDFHTYMFACFLSQEEPKRVHQALKDPSRIEAMQEELLQFKMQNVWILVDLPHRKRAIGHTQEEGINYEEVFASVARIKAIRLFLAYASFMGFMVYQMDVKSAFLYGTIEEEVYVYEPSGFEDPDHPDKVYKVVKALYGLHQAPRAWYETLANYLLENGFHREKIDQTLFIKKQKGDILLVQIYIDDIIFSATNKDLCKSFEKLMKDKFQISSMGELTFFLGLRVKQKKDRIFISQDKYVAEILKKFGLTEGKSACTPIDTEKPLLKDLDGKDVDVYIYRSMIGSLMYLTSSRLDIMFASNGVTRLQALVDKKKLVITEAAIRDVLRLDDADGVDCLPNEEIFAELACMGYEKPSTKLTFYKAFFSSQWKFLIHIILQSMSAKCTSWNEFSLAMAFAVICLSIGRNFNFSKYIFESLVRNVDSSSKFYMYPRVEKGFSRVETPLFKGMLVTGDIKEKGDAEEQIEDNVNNAAQGADTAVLEDDEALNACTSLTRRVEHLEHDKVTQDLEITKLKTRVKKLERTNKGRMISNLDRDTGVALMDKEGIERKAKDAQVTDDEQVKGRQAEIYQIDMDRVSNVLSMEEDEPKVQEAVDVVTTAKIITKVVAAVSETVTAASQLLLLFLLLL
nr:hypothetical protein [Tanacetum cinerariifolium]